ncbi:carbohydrate esterase family 5 protein [Xylariaceae sp. FL0594]|nr:carbohydrate esterase family 5 protein [Xylariaceae sp. FL0594]
MKFSLLTSTALMGLAAAVPMTFDLSPEMIEKLKTGKSSGIIPVSSSPTLQAAGTTANEFLEGGCRPLIFIYARGSTQDGNIGASPGPQTIDGLKAVLGADNVAAQGVEYPATLLDNLYPGGCDPDDAKNMRDLIALAATQCPDSKIAVAGYSQGAALVHASIEISTPEIRESRIVAAVTFGDTQKKQDGGKIPGFDEAKTLILCHEGDLVCKGTLIIVDAHHDYDDLAPQAVEFIAARV